MSRMAADRGCDALSKQWMGVQELICAQSEDHVARNDLSRILCDPRVIRNEGWGTPRPYQSGSQGASPTLLDVSELDWQQQPACCEPIVSEYLSLTRE